MRRLAELLKMGVKHKRILMRADLNIPLDETGHPRDATRLTRLVDDIKTLSNADARVIILAHFGRPKGRPDPQMSLAPIAKILAEYVQKPIEFAPDCIGKIADAAVVKLKAGAILVLENTRFHKDETQNNPNFAKALAQHGDAFVNNAFSVAHREHASTSGIAKHLPSFAGTALTTECDALTNALKNPERPLIAIIGGAKISTKLTLIDSLMNKSDRLVIGGAMANTLLAATGLPIGKSLYEADMLDTAGALIEKAQNSECTLILPHDVVVAESLAPHVDSRIIANTQVQKNEMILDCGTRSISLICEAIAQCKTLIWNGPLGAFETPPFDAATTQVARYVAARTKENALISIGGGGDTLAALAHANVQKGFTYLSTAGGAFLEWMEGKQLPALKVLDETK